MKLLTVIALFSFSVSSFAAVQMRSFQECTNTVSARVSAEVQKAELTKCAEGRAVADLSQKCEGRGTAWLMEANIAKRDYKQYVGPEGRTMTVGAMAVGRCEFNSQF